MRNDALGLFWRDEPAVKRTAAPKVKRQPPKPTWLAEDYLPGLAEAMAFNVPLMSDGELYRWGGLPTSGTMVFDIEIYRNYFLAAFKHVETGKICYVESDMLGTINLQKLQFIMSSFLTVGFNSNGFDMPITAMALNGCSVQQMKDATQRIIEYKENYRDVLKSYKTRINKHFNHIDLIEVAPLFGSLKAYAGRLHARRMQDLPFDPQVTLTGDQVAIIRYYCVNDLTNTHLMMDALKEQLELRVSMSAEYGIDLRSKSDAQIAEYVIGQEVAKLNGYRAEQPVIVPGTTYRYKTPQYMTGFRSQLMQWALKTVQDAPFVVADHGSIEMPETVKNLKLDINGTVYTMGIGGLHSTESKTAHIAGGGYKLFDFDVTSYYPMIILNQGLFPSHLGQAFLRVYNMLVRRRLDAKASKQTLIANSLKIVINGSYGKLGSKWSKLYAPDLLVQVTMTGQLSLLLLIEWLEMSGIRVVSANTDGIVIKPHESQEALMRDIIKYWEQQTKFEMEGTEYSGLYSRDVNSYYAVKTDGTVKSKGAYANPWNQTKDISLWMHKNPSAQICTEAVEKFLVDRTPIERTIMDCKDMKKFVSVRAVKGGAVMVLEKAEPPAHSTREELIALAGYESFFGGTWLVPGESDRTAVGTEQAYNNALAMLMTPEKCEYLGKTVRWYYAHGNNGEMVYALSGNKVPKSDGAKPLMDMPDYMMQDVDYDWYIDESNKILKQIGLV